jgi:hypothetical protein
MTVQLLDHLSKPLQGKYLDEFKASISDQAVTVAAYYRWCMQNPKWDELLGHVRRLEREMPQALQQFQKKIENIKSLSFDELSHELELLDQKVGGDMAVRNRIIMEDFEALCYLQNEGLDEFKKWVSSMLVGQKGSGSLSEAGSFVINQAIIDRREDRGHHFSSMLYKLYMEGVPDMQIGMLAKAKQKIAENLGQPASSRKVQEAMDDMFAQQAEALGLTKELRRQGLGL